MAQQARGEIVPLMSPEGIVMYPHVFEPNPEKDDQGKVWHQVMLKFPKDEVGEDDLKTFRKQLAVAAKQGVEFGVYEDYKHDDFASPLRDGDKFNKLNNKKRKEELMGHWYINFKSEGAPEVVDGTKAGLPPIISRKDFYPGAKAVVSGVAFPYNNKGNEGVGVRLTNVCKTGDGERIGGKPAAKGQFEKYAKGAPGKAVADDGDDLL